MIECKKLPELNQNSMIGGLTESHISQMIKILAKYSFVEEAILFGSRAKGNFQPGSDVDISLKGKNLSINHLISILNDLDDSDLPFTFDINLYCHIREPALIDHIDRVGITLFRKV